MSLGNYLVRRGKKRKVSNTTFNGAEMNDTKDAMQGIIVVKNFEDTSDSMQYCNSESTMNGRDARILGRIFFSFFLLLFGIIPHKKRTPFPQNSFESTNFEMLFATSSSFTALRAKFARCGDKSRKNHPKGVVAVSMSAPPRDEEDDDVSQRSTMPSSNAPKQCRQSTIMAKPITQKATTTKRQKPTKSRRHSLVALTAGAFALSNAAFRVQSSTAAAIFGGSSVVGSNYDDDDGMTYVYFGNGCFWGRQHEFVALEKDVLHRSDVEVKSLAGYAGGKRGGGGKNRDTVCYYYGSSDTVYERLGHAEVVQVAYADEEEFKKFCEVYFRNFNKTPFGMQRVDPQDAGPGYRNVVGIPGGIDNEKLMKQMKSANANDMKLVRGEGNEFDARGKPTENDQINVVWIVDSEKLPFYPAEMYHQFHDGLGYKFPESYTVDLKRTAAKSGSIGPVPGCPEMRERAFADFVESAEG